MIERSVEIPVSSWMTALEVAQVCVRSWRAELLEYDVTPTGGTITLSLPYDQNLHMIGVRDLIERAEWHLARSYEVLRHARNRATETRACLDRIRSHLAASS